MALDPPQVEPSLASPTYTPLPPLVHTTAAAMIVFDGEVHQVPPITNTVPVSQCSVCEAVVPNSGTDGHTQWHAELFTALDQLWRR